MRKGSRIRYRNECTIHFARGELKFEKQRTTFGKCLITSFFRKQPDFEAFH